MCDFGSIQKVHHSGMWGGKLTEKVTKSGIRESVCSKKVILEMFLCSFFSAIQFSVSVVQEALVLLQ